MLIGDSNVTNGDEQQHQHNNNHIINDGGEQEKHFFFRGRGAHTHVRHTVNVRNVGFLGFNNNVCVIVIKGKDGDKITQ